MLKLHHIVNSMTILTVANAMTLSRDIRTHRFTEDSTMIMVNLVVCWLDVELALGEAYGPKNSTQNGLHPWLGVRP